MSSLRRQLKAYGASGQQVRELPARLTAGTVRYADIVNAASDRPDAVVEEAAGQPLAYIIDGRPAALTPEKLRRLRRVLAFRGDAPFLAVVLPGRLDVYEVGLDVASLGEKPVDRVQITEPRATSVFPRLHLTPSGEPGEQVAIHHQLFELMKEAIDQIYSPRDKSLSHLVSREDALSIVGRAVFTRFLYDRRLLPDEELARMSEQPADPRSLFSDAASAATTCRWLDRTFNGDFLPVNFELTPDNLRKRLSKSGWQALSNIMYGAPGGQLHLGQHLTGWASLDFARIPVGVLSQVYEQQAFDWTPQKRRTGSVYYTPEPIADFMVREVFAELDRAETDHRTVRMLDPAVGGGVFLVSAFRELVARQWRRDRRQPSTKKIRKILYQQLAGFDVEVSALRLTALSLYLAAIELDPSPFPLSRLKFEPLLGSVLHYVGGTDAAGQAGSLGSNVGEQHAGRYDVVIGNPPWTSAKIQKDVRVEIEETVRPLVRSRLGDEEGAGFRLPDGNPDIAFLWRATEWCRPSGLVALIGHARLLFKQSPVGASSRVLLMRGVEWTGIVNGAAVRRSEVWPNVTAPFAIFFGVNRLPSSQASTYFYSPYAETSLNARGRFRIDAESAHGLPIRTVQRNPWILKTLFRGTRLDVGIVERLRAAGPSLEEYWEELGLSFSQGYFATPTQKQHDASALVNLPTITTKSVGTSPSVDPHRLPPFRLTTLHRPRSPEIYKAPLVLFRKRIPTSVAKPTVFVVESDAVYDHSFYGFSCHGHSDASTLARYVQLAANGELLRWYALMLSGQYGVEREALYFEDVRRFPIRRLDTLPDELRAEIAPLSQLYRESGCITEQHVTWLQALYGLDRWDWSSIADDLSTSAPEAKSTKNAERAPEADELRRFKDTLTSVLQDATGERPAVELMLSDNQSPWIALHVGKEARSTSWSAPLDRLLQLADEYAASQLVMPLADGSVVVGLLQQYRYVTTSRARLLALDLLRRSDVELGRT